MKNKIKKAIIPAAGLGTRFLPATKAIPKEMLAIVDKPAIQYIVEEVVKSGIKDILIIVSSNKNALVDHFDSNFELETALKNKNKILELNQVLELNELANIQYVRQKYPLGLGDAIKCAKAFIDDEPFAVILGDDVIINKDKNQKPGLMQCIDAFNKTNKMVVGVQNVPHEDTSKYGIIDIAKNKDNTKEYFYIDNIVEKPDSSEAKSDFAIIGRYILTPAIFKALDEQELSSRGEIELTPALEAVLEKDQAVACDIKGDRYDIGSKFGFIKATIDQALIHDAISEDVKNYIKELAKKL